MIIKRLNTVIYVLDNCQPYINRFKLLNIIIINYNFYFFITKQSKKHSHIKLYIYNLVKRIF